MQESGREAEGWEREGWEGGGREGGGEGGGGVVRLGGEEGSGRKGIRMTHGTFPWTEFHFVTA